MTHMTTVRDYIHCLLRGGCTGSGHSLGATGQARPAGHGSCSPVSRRGPAGVACAQSSHTPSDSDRAGEWMQHLAGCTWAARGVCLGARSGTWPMVACNDRAPRGLEGCSSICFMCDQRAPPTRSCRASRSSRSWCFSMWVIVCAGVSRTARKPKVCPATCPVAAG
jgi:hypothetical protein